MSVVVLSTFTFILSTQEEMVFLSWKTASLISWLMPFEGLWWRSSVHSPDADHWLYWHCNCGILYIWIFCQTCCLSQQGRHLVVFSEVIYTIMFFRLSFSLQLWMQLTSYVWFPFTFRCCWKAWRMWKLLERPEKLSDFSKFFAYSGFIKCSSISQAYNLCSTPFNKLTKSWVCCCTLSVWQQ